MDTTYGKNKEKSWASVRVAGEFVSFIICASKYPYRTRLTILARRNGFECMTLADDMRPQSENTTSLLGLAVMLLLDEAGHFKHKCQLVGLDTLVNKTEQFVERNPIQVSFKSNFTSCALISETEALVFASKEVILVSLVS